jgi:hypothetical protein
MENSLLEENEEPLLPNQPLMPDDYNVLPKIEAEPSKLQDDLEFFRDWQKFRQHCVELNQIMNKYSHDSTAKLKLNATFNVLSNLHCFK